MKSAPKFPPVKKPEAYEPPAIVSREAVRDPVIRSVVQPSA